MEADSPLRERTVAMTRHVGVPRARRLLVGESAAAQHLGEAPVDDLHLAEGADHDVAGFRSRWMTPRAWA